ncbi:hypothetical protein PFISCL1PPCAC_14025, partial [Pristionchus fissidentatus]
CNFFYQDAQFDITAINVHNLSESDEFLAFGGRLFAMPEHAESVIKVATQSILPTYFAAYAIFVWCITTIYRLRIRV